MEELKVLITTSGVGSRLGELTDFTNKSLVRVGSMPIITHIIESYPKETSFVVTLGYYGNHVREYLTIAHSDRKFIFVEVENFAGKGSSQLYSMSHAKKELQCPFIFHACDTISEGHSTKIDSNWVAAFKVDNADQYRTLRIDSGLNFEGFNEKGEIAFDYAYPGICGIKDFKSFWKSVEEILEDSKSKNLSDCDVINRMLSQKKCNFKIAELKNWYDIGNVSELERTRANFKEEFDVLDKPRENIYFHNNSVIKFFHDESMIKKRVARCEYLKGLVPELEASSKHFFKYKFVEGKLFANSATPSKMKNFLDWVSKSMWSKNSKKDISDECQKFYFDKTLSRIDAMLSGAEDKITRINGEDVPPIHEMLSSIDRKWLCNGKSGTIHGDLILDNVIETNTGFVLIDWRQDFANRKDFGDVYYDLAKLSHNLTFNHELVNAKKYSLEHSDDGLICDILCKKNLLDCKEVLDDFIVKNGYDKSKVDLLTSIVWINMSPLHEHPLDKFLFNFGKYNLYRCLKKRGQL